MPDNVLIPPLGGLPVDDDAADLAAELDDADPAELDDDPEDADAPPEAWSLMCVGGPYAGRSIISRYPKGFLLVDRPTSRAWLYDTAGEQFVCRDGMTPMVLDTAGRWRAAEEDSYDVVVYDLEAQS